MAKRRGLGVLLRLLRFLIYVAIIVLIIWLGRNVYEFGYHVFNQQAMSPGNGQEVSVVINEGATPYQIGQALEKKGLVDSALVFYVQERLSIYHGKLKPGTYVLSTAYKPDQIMEILAGDDEDSEEEEDMDGD